MPRPVIGSERRTNPLIWCLAIICTVLTVLVIITGIVVFVGYLAIRPTIPYVSVTYAHLDDFNYNRAGVLNTKLTIVFKAENDNLKAHASFSNFIYELELVGIPVARLRIKDPFDVGKNDTVLFNFLVESNSIPLDKDQMAKVDSLLKENKVAFDLNGHTRTRWRVGPLGSLKILCHLHCQLQFQLIDGNSIDSQCTTKSK